MKWEHRILVSILLVIGCGGTKPLGSEVTGYMDVSLIHALYQREPLTQLMIVGRSGSTPGNGSLTATNRKTSEALSVFPAADGSFVILPQQWGGERIRLTYVNGEVMHSLDFNAPLPPPLQSGGGGIIESVLVTPGEFSSYLIDLVTSVPVTDRAFVAVNPDRLQASDFEQTDAQSFSATVEGQAGDTIQIYFVNADGPSQPVSEILP